MPGTDTVLELADESHLDVLLPLVRAYHRFENVVMSDVERAVAVAPLLQAKSPLGRIWLVRQSGEVAGYGALCFGYSIEFGGRDAFVDELYIAEHARGRGLGSRVLDLLKSEAARLGIVALHLEVARNNTGARQLYEKWGFRTRERYVLMSCHFSGTGVAASRPAV
jgi:ribosomal protein S18 acetylase RimI-like enzyme